MPWVEEAACAGMEDPSIFFPRKGGSSAPAKRICDQCPVRIQCLNEALHRPERHGVWGGMSERERRRLLQIAAA
jgi:WhiB family redox-sensing transcriptional regulator